MTIQSSIPTLAIEEFVYNFLAVELHSEFLVLGLQDLL